MPKSVMDLANPQYKGKLELAPGETDFWPIVTSIERAKGQTAALNWLKAIKSNAGSDDHTPDNETLVSDVSKGDADMGLINHYYFYRLRDEMGAGNFHAKLSLLHPRDPGYVEDISGAGILKSSQEPGGGAEVPRVHDQRRRAARARRQHQLRVPARPRAWRRTRHCRRSSTFEPNPITPAQIGTGTDAQDLLQQAGLL